MAFSPRLRGPIAQNAVALPDAAAPPRPLALPVDGERDDPPPVPPRFPSGRRGGRRRGAPVDRGCGRWRLTAAANRAAACKPSSNAAGVARVCASRGSVGGGGEGNPGVAAGVRCGPSCQMRPDGVSVMHVCVCVCACVCVCVRACVCVHSRACTSVAISLAQKAHGRLTRRR